MARWRLVNLPVHKTDSRPQPLVVAELGAVTRGLFDAARRVYWIVNNGDTTIRRGAHYHPEGGKQELMVAFHGQAKVELHSREECDTVLLDTPYQALVIPSGVWHEVLLTPGAALVVVASTNFQPDESHTELPCKCFH